jgi:lipopolysaccharide/colanic/teichoic acid biosynthesis glycosyltransferase
MQLAMNSWQRFLKRTFDVVAAFSGLCVTGWIILIAWLIATIDTRRNGFFRQERVGRHGKLFKIVKIRTMRNNSVHQAHVTVAGDPRITRTGSFLRASKIDELPQLFNVLIGDMSFVGPRPDVEGFADRLTGDDRLILSLRPGITGPATLAFRNEEELLADQEDPEEYNRNTLYPQKVALNRKYLENWSFGSDLRLIIATLLPK